MMFITFRKFYSWIYKAVESNLTCYIPLNRPFLHIRKTVAVSYCMSFEY